MNLKSALKRVATNLPEILAGTALVVIVILECSNAICRYAFKYTFIFVDDCVVVAFAWAVFAGTAAAYRRKMHYGLDVLTNILSKKVQPYFHVFLQVIISVLLFFLAYLSIVLLINSGDKILFTTGISFKWVDLAVVYGLVMMSVYSIMFLIQDLIVIKRKEGRDSK